MTDDERKSVILDYIEYNLSICNKWSNELRSSIKNSRNTKKKLISMMVMIDNIDVIKTNLLNFYKQLDNSVSISKEEFKKYNDNLKEIVLYIFFEDDESYKEDNFRSLIDGLRVER